MWHLSSWDWRFFASGTVRADETSPTATSNLDQQIKQVAGIEETKAEPVKEEGRVEAEKQETPATDTSSADLLPEDIQDRAYPDNTCQRTRYNYYR